MAINYVTLKNEINTDPKALGYAGKSDYDTSVLLNTVGASNETIFTKYLAFEDFVAAIVRADYDALTGLPLAYLNNVLLGPGVRIESGNATLRSQIAALFPAGTTTRTNLTNAASRSASRAEVLFGEGTYITDADVAKARVS